MPEVRGQRALPVKTTFLSNMRLCVAESLHNLRLVTVTSENIETSEIKNYTVSNIKTKT